MMFYGCFWVQAGFGEIGNEWFFFVLVSFCFFSRWMDAYDFSTEKELLLLCLKNKVAKAKKLLNSGKRINLNFRNLHGETALYFAARHKSDLALTLLKLGADPCIRTISNQSILHQIGISGNVELLKAVFERPDAKRLTYGEVRSWDGLSPVHLVAKHGHQEVLEEFKEIGLGLNIKSWAGATALHYTIAHSRFSSTLFLFDQNVGVNSRTYSFGYMLRKPHSPLHILLHWPEVDAKDELYEKVLRQMILRRARIRGCRACKAKEPCNLFAAERLAHYYELKMEMKPLMTATRGGSLIGMFKRKKDRPLTPPLKAKGSKPSISPNFRNASSPDNLCGDDYDDDELDEEDKNDLKDIDEDKLARVRAVTEHSAKA